MLGMLLDDFERAAAGYQMETLLPDIRCPVLLMQADPAAGSGMSDEDVARALPLLAKPAHVCFKGVGHTLFIEDKEGFLRTMQTYLMDFDNYPTRIRSPNF